jgi:hypothetical protein
MGQLKRFPHGSAPYFAKIDSIAISLQNRRSFVDVSVEKLTVTVAIKAPDRKPGLACYIHIFRVATGFAFFTEFGLEYIQERYLSAVRIARLTQCEAAWNLSSNQPDPPL